ncbi:MAG: hypothetical protein ACEPO2_01075 [Pelagibaca sp.]
MTTHFSTTVFTANEAPLETPKARAFPKLLGALSALIEAERDLEDTSYSQDPAYAAWMREAEVAHEHLTETLRHFNGLPNINLADRPLERMALLIDAMLGHEEPGGARKLQLRMHLTFFRDFQVSGISATAMQRNAILIQACHLVTALGALPLFDGIAETTFSHDECSAWENFSL